jgi:hypothetical protein
MSTSDFSIKVRPWVLAFNIKDRAACKIQRAWRRYRLVIQIDDDHRRQWAAGLIRRYWLLHRFGYTDGTGNWTSCAQLVFLPLQKPGNLFIRCRRDLSQVRLVRQLNT